MTTWNVMFHEAASAKIVEALQIELESLKRDIESGQQHRDLESVIAKYDRLLNAARLSLHKIKDFPESPDAFGAVVAEAIRGLENSYWFGDVTDTSETA